VTADEITARLTALKALPPGKLSTSVSYGGRTYQESYASMEAIAAEIARLETALAQLTSSEQRPRLWYLTGSRGT
jgi:hypothetical protein